ncbi:branched-chain amino acid aminotransferase [Micrococcales bacterium 31B]|nr:branched-chain amino acid aminotransferase [Micrococcales bacterium 31B]
MSTSYTFSVTRNPSAASAAERAKVLENPGFGNFMTDHMVMVDWTLDDGWGEGKVVPYGPLQLDPSASVLHYGQEIFEGLKAYRHADGSVWGFRPQANAERFNRSARRLAMTELPEHLFVDACQAIVEADLDWVPSGGETSLYLRPFMIASEPFLGVRSAHRYTFMVIASPAGAYFSGGIKPVDIWVSEEYTRAAPGGTGAAKCGGNYAASLIAQQQAAEHGCQQVCFLDAVERRWIEELGGMNVYFVYGDEKIVTPELSGTILEGITRDSILTLAREQGHTVVEQRVDINEVRADIESGAITEIFACGTAAVVTPIGSLQSADSKSVVQSSEPGADTLGIREALLDIQYGRTPDTHGWMHRFA